MSFSENQKEKWKELILQQKNSNQNITEWCKGNKINLRQFHYWKSKLFHQLIERSSFTEIGSVDKSSGISIELRKIRIHLDKNFDQVVLKDCLSILRRI